MGGGNSVEVYRNIVLQTTAEIIVKKIQQAGVKLLQTQDLVVSCDEFTRIVVNAYEACLEKHKTLELCAPLLEKFSCGAGIINMKQSLVMSGNIGQDSTLQTDIKTSVENSLETKLKDATGFLTFGDKTVSDIKTYIKAVTSVWNNNAQSAVYNLAQKQGIEIRGTKVDFASLDQTQQAIQLDILQKNSDVINAASNVANDLREQYDSSWNADKTLYVILGVVGIVILIAVIVVAVRFIKKRSAKAALAEDPGLTIKITGTPGQNRLVTPSKIPEANM